MTKLRKIGRILLLVAGIFSLLGIFAYLLVGVALMIAPNLIMQIEGVDLGEQVEQLIPIVGVVVGVLMIFTAIFSLVAGILEIKAFKTHEKGLYIANIVFAVLTGSLLGTLLALAGSVLGLISLHKENKALKAEEPQQPVEEAK